MTNFDESVKINHNPNWLYKILKRRLIPNPEVLCSKPLGDTKVDSAFHSSEVDQMSTRNFWELCSKQ